MILDPETIKKALDTKEVDRREPISAGENILTIKDVKAKLSKNGNPMVLLDLIKDEMHKILMVNYTLSSETGATMLVQFMMNSFGYVMQPSETEEDVVNQIRQYIGVKFKAAIRLKERLNEDGSRIFTYPDLWYTGKIDDTSFMVSNKKLTVELSKEDKARHSKHIQSLLNPMAEQNNNDLPF